MKFDFTFDFIASNFGMSGFLDGKLLPLFVVLSTFAVMRTKRIAEAKLEEERARQTQMDDMEWHSFSVKLKAVIIDVNSALFSLYGGSTYPYSKGISLLRVINESIRMSFGLDYIKVLALIQQKEWHRQQGNGNFYHGSGLGGGFAGFRDTF